MARRTKPSPSNSSVEFHRPVMVARVVELCSAVPPGLAVDGTVGGGGHAAALLEASPHLRLVAADRDPSAVAAARRRLVAFGGRAEVIRCDLATLPAVIDEHGGRVSAVVLDFGLSSHQVDDPTRGFSFTREGPLDMRADPSLPTSAETIVNALPEEWLANVIFRYGEERGSRAIARRIVRARPVRTTTRLADVVAEGVPERFRVKTLARVFQALRIAVNNELGQIESAVPQLARRLVVGGRAVTLTYHSIEDRTVRNSFRGLSRSGRFREIVRTPERPDGLEVRLNPRSRSARLRALERVS